MPDAIPDEEKLAIIAAAALFAGPHADPALDGWGDETAADDLADMVGAGWKGLER